MTKFTRLLMTTAALAVVLGGAAQADVWDGGAGDNEFNTALNWDTDLSPVGGAANTSTTSTIDNGDTVQRLVDSATGRLFIEDGSTLNITGGTHSDGRSGAGIRNFVGRGSFATVNQSGGDYNIGHMLSIGGGGASGDGAYFLSGGSLTLSRGSNSIIDDTNPLGRPSLEVSDEEDAGAGLFEISGGSLATRASAGVGTTGVFSIVGSGATSIDIGSNGSLDGGWIQQTGGTLKIAIDGGGVTPIFIDEVDGDDLAGANGDVIFHSGSLLDVSFVGGDVLSTFTVMTWEGTVTDNGLAFAPGVDTDLWSFSVNANSLTVKSGDDPTGNADFDADNDVDGKDFLTWQQNVGFTAPIDLQPFGDANSDAAIDGVDLIIWETQYGLGTPLSAISAVPEPASLALISFACLALMGSRRKA